MNQLQIVSQGGRLLVDSRQVAEMVDKDHAHLLRDIRGYIDKTGKEATRKGITFNPFLKTKLVGVLGSSFLKAGGYYRGIYDGYRFRLENRPDTKELSKGHKHNRAIRYAVKMFLRDLWLAWREIEGLTVGTDYAEGKLGIKHSEKEVSV